MVGYFSVIIPTIEHHNPCKTFAPCRNLSFVFMHNVTLKRTSYDSFGNSGETFF